MDDFEALQSIEIEEGSKYRWLFSSPMGREVLADLLTECHFGITLDPDNKVQVAEYNVGVMILTKCGIFGEKNKMDVINSLCNIIPIKEVVK